MTAHPNRSDADVRAELARLVPGPADRDLPSDSHLRLQEFLMSEIHRDRRDTRPAARRSPLRRPFLVTAALTAATAVAAVVGVAVTAGPTDRTADRTADRTTDRTTDRATDPAAPAGQTPTRATPSGPDILLAAATTAQRQPAQSGKYWYTKVVAGDTRWENWYDHDGNSWIRSKKFGERPLPMPEHRGFRLGGAVVTLRQIQDLPTEPGALTAWVTGAVENADLRNSGGPFSAEKKKEYVLYGLIGLVSYLPAPPAVRAAAFGAVAGYPNVTNLGPVEGGDALQITLQDVDRPVRLVVDPDRARIHRSTFVVAPDGGLYFSSSIDMTAEWTDTLPG